ncbi:MAG: hypothetical protein O3B31_06200 [Chloroflexi bacterium]|nr:hypothetical protein [Chloroflexota bacterium]
MGCPVHIWLPVMAGLAPIGRIARDRLRSLRADRGARTAAAEPRPELKRWAPIQPHAGADRNAPTSD